MNTKANKILFITVGIIFLIFLSLILFFVFNLNKEEEKVGQNNTADYGRIKKIETLKDYKEELSKCYPFMYSDSKKYLECKDEVYKNIKNVDVCKKFKNRSLALKEESEIKKLKRQEKLNLINKN